MSLAIKIIRSKYLTLLSLFGLVLFMALSFSSVSHATAVSGFDAGHIIDDAIFTNSNSMNTSQIQAFLNSKVPACDTNGTQPATDFGRSDLTHAQYAASRGWPAPPYPCLKDYIENGLSSAQIIYNIAQQFHINPQVFIVLLQKEQGLVTDTWPLPVQYRTATGYGCPDTAPCDSQYFGLTSQLTWSGRLFRSVLDNSPTWYSPYVLGNNFIQWSPNSACGGSTVFIQNGSTQALYDYTPYQPNQAALNAGYGAGDSCSSHGNRNFYLYFTDWFGVANSPSLYVAVIQDPSSPNLYLQTSAGKHLIPSVEVMQNWGLDKYPVLQVSQAYFDSLPTKNQVNRLVKDDWGNLFFIDDGKLHYIRNNSYVTLWNLDASKAVQSLGLVYTMPGGLWMGRFVRDTNQPTGQIWLIDGGTKHAMPDGNSLYEWGYAPEQLVTLTTDYLDSIPTSTVVSQYATGGSTKYFVDMGRKLTFANTDIENAFVGSQSPVSYATNTLSYLATENARQFVVDISNGCWYMLENGKKHYITTGRIAELWGKSPSQAPTRASHGFITGLPNGGNLQYIVQTANPSMSWVVDGTKRYINTATVANAWILPGATIPTYSTQSLNHLSRGSDITNIINGSGSPFSYLMDNGSKRYLSTSGAINGWGSANSTVSNSLVASIPEGSFISNIIKNSSGAAFLIMSGKAYPIDSLFYDAWGVSSATRSAADQTVARYPVGPTLKAFIRIAGVSYIMNNGQKIPIKKYVDAYPANISSEVTLPADYLSTATEASYLIKSTDNNDSRIWLMANGKKLLLSSFEQKVSYGYISQGIQPTALTPSTLELIPDDSQSFSLLIQKPNSGIKLLSFGYSLGFPNGDTLLSYISASNQIIQLSPSVFDRFVALRAASRLIRDDRGNYYWMENGFKRHIATLSTLAQHRAVNQETYFESTTMNLIPLGPSIN